MNARAFGLVLGWLAVAASPAASAEPFDWRTATPESQGLSGEKLAALKDTLAAHGTKAFLVIRNDAIVYEWYAAGRTAATPHYTASVAKAVVGGLSLAVALDDGRLALDDPAAKYIPQWRDDPRKSRITVRQLGSHTSGLADANQEGVPKDKLPGWMAEFWKRHSPPTDPFTLSRDAAPVLFDPGTQYQYSNPGIAMLTYAVTAALKGTPHADVRTLLRERVMRPIGVPDKEWSAGYGTTVQVDGLPLVGSWGGGGYTARALARVGRLMLRQGDWDGRRVLKAESVRQITTDAGLPANFGMGWWTNAGGRHPTMPCDAFWGAGAGDQFVLVVPSLNLIAVRNGEKLNTEFFGPLMTTVTQRAAATAPYPPSSVITGIEWAPKETIVRQAKGSDNWPLTWGDDDHLYTAYGDGNGFVPFVPRKLSLGLARIEGPADAFKGINLRAPTAERLGEGAKGLKASGMLMVDGVLYMWVRNAGAAQLAWSADRGATWTWADWKFTTGFGAPTFLNFGRNYAGARDQYVYVYSHDHESAYEPAGRMVLARVPKDRIGDRGTYEFFEAIGPDGPRWTPDIERRGAVFSHPGRCYRSGITYNAGLKRYLWCQILPESTHPQGMRFQGGFGLYDAPEPWGPWTTVFFTNAWDVGPGETSSLPTKWMSGDGRTLHLVFSGDDCFSVRRATLTTKPR